jgi:hypothetical protein
VVLAGHGVLAGRGATMVVITLCTRLGVRVDLCFAFFAGFKRVTLGYLGDP